MPALIFGTVEEGGVARKEEYRKETISSIAIFEKMAFLATPPSRSERGGRNILPLVIGRIWRDFRSFFAAMQFLMMRFMLA